MEGFWRADRFLRLVIAPLLLIAIRGSFIQGLERGAHYVRLLAAKRLPVSRIYAIRFDDLPIATIGRLPWLADTRAAMTNLPTWSSAFSVGCMACFFGPRPDGGCGSTGQFA